jgi:hypothetical protein
VTGVAAFSAFSALSALSALSAFSAKRRNGERARAKQRGGPEGPWEHSPGFNLGWRAKWRPLLRSGRYRFPHVDHSSIIGKSQVNRALNGPSDRPPKNHQPRLKLGLSSQGLRAEPVAPKTYLQCSIRDITPGLHFPLLRYSNTRRLCPCCTHSTVTLFAKFRGLSTSHPRCTAKWYANS